MENRIITIEELEIGDEILISCQSYFKYLKVLVKPKLSKIKKHWNTKQPLYANVRCSTRKETILRTYKNGVGGMYSREEHVWEMGGENHNTTVSVDLQDRQLFLIKKV